MPEILLLNDAIYWGRVIRRKYDNYVRGDPNNPDLRRKAYTAVAAKVARVTYALIKTGADYCRFIEAMEPSGRIPSQQP